MRTDRAIVPLVGVFFLAGCSSSSSPASGASDAGATLDDAAQPPSPVSGEGGGGGDAATPAADDAGDAGTGASASDDGGAVFGDGGSTNMRGQRYCEVLGATLTGTTINAAVYSTWGLNDCPEAQWSAESPTALAQQLGVTQAQLNGPRYWMMDSLQGTLISTTQVTLGGIAMHEAGAISATYSPTTTLGSPYVTHQIQRNTVVTFAAGKPVYELTDPQGKIYDMQSYSTQKVTTQTQSTLAGLGATLTLPKGWSWRTRVLSADLVLPTPGGFATVVQDDNDNTYQQSQQ